MRILSVIGLVLMFALVGSASAGTRSTISSKSTTYEVDTEKVAYVNHTARKRGVQVIWVHKPKKRTLIAAKD